MLQPNLLLLPLLRGGRFGRTTTNTATNATTIPAPNPAPARTSTIAAAAGDTTIATATATTTTITAAAAGANLLLHPMQHAIGLFQRLPQVIRLLTPLQAR